MKTSFFKTIILFVMIFANADICNSQTFYALSQRVSDNMEFLSKVNPMTGSTTLISTTGLAKNMAQGVSTIDPINKRFFFMSLGDTLYTVDLTTGNLITKNKSSLSGTYTNYLFEFNCIDTTLYAISQRVSDNMEFLSKVNPMTGSTTLISPTGLAKNLAQGVSTIDPINKRFFFMSLGDTLYTVDLTTGNLLAKNKSSLTGTYTNYLFEFNYQDTTLYALSQRTLDAMEFLSKVNPMTGSTTLISTTGLAKNMAQGVSTIDPINKRFFFMSLGDTLYTVDLTTGNLLAKNTSSLTGTYTNYIFEFEKPCPSFSTGIDNKYEPIISSYKIFPNPFSLETTLQTNEILKDATLIIYNYLGQQVNQIQNIFGQTIKINRDNLSKGLYFIRLTQDSKIMLTEKLIIND